MNQSPRLCTLCSQMLLETVPTLHILVHAHIAIAHIKRHIIRRWKHFDQFLQMHTKQRWLLHCQCRVDIHHKIREQLFTSLQLIDFSANTCKLLEQLQFDHHFPMMPQIITHRLKQIIFSLSICRCFAAGIIHKALQQRTQFLDNRFRCGFHQFVNLNVVFAFMSLTQSLQQQQRSGINIRRSDGKPSKAALSDSGHIQIVCVSIEQQFCFGSKRRINRARKIARRATPRRLLQLQYDSVASKHDRHAQIFRGRHWTAQPRA
mmetsp:Transcript_3879/g.6513  ORF Transcript_3879/g.6513 Transcript_3879/m.6513 type:complete len:262 (+) Transcript_3879:262-1047(+)